MGLFFLIIFILFLIFSLSSYKARAISTAVTCGLYILLRDHPVIFFNLMGVVCILMGVIQAFIKNSPKRAVLVFIFIISMPLFKSHFFSIEDTQALAAQDQIKVSDTVKNSEIPNMAAEHIAKRHETQNNPQRVKGNQ